MSRPCPLSKVCWGQLEVAGVNQVQYLQILLCEGGQHVVHFLGIWWDRHVQLTTILLATATTGLQVTQQTEGLG